MTITLENEVQLTGQLSALNNVVPYFLHVTSAATVKAESMYPAGILIQK